MSTTTFYFVRHGETEYNRRRIMQGRRIDSTLNETGRRQAQALARRFAGVPLDAVYTSTLKRAVETGATVVAAQERAVPRYELAGLDEMSWGVYEGEPPSERLYDALRAIHARWDRGEYGYRVEEGESILQVQERGLRALEHIRERHEGETVLVVTHGRFLRVLLASVLEPYGLERMQEIRHANTAVNRLVWEAGRFTSELLNCTAHLDEVDTVVME